MKSSSICRVRVTGFLDFARTDESDALARIRSVGERRSSVTEPEEKPLRTVSFVVHATRGVIRDPKVRRKAMFVLIGVSLLLLLAGSTFLQAPLNPREHPLGFLLFWIICGWLTFTAVLLAIFDMLMVRLESRRERRAVRENLKTKGSTGTGSLASQDLE